ncbi:MAG: glycosyltransferase family 4 protein [Acidimicrobiales bacterium]
MTAIHQLVPSFGARDAIGAHTLQVQRVLRGLGLRSEIYVGDAHREVRRSVHPYRDLEGARGGEPTWLLYQCSTGSPVADWLLHRPERKLSNYHNITPAPFFEPWEPHVGAELAEARRQLGELAPAIELGIADSAYNEAELVAVGYRRTTVVPILLDTATFEHDVDRAELDRLLAVKAKGGADWLFVGRVAPHKAQHDLIKAFAAYRRVYDPLARLHVIGGSSSHAYWTALERFVADADLGEAVDLAGSVSPGVLAARYRVADAFVCVSEHEGFCVPLLEAMHHEVPIVAYGVTAVPETLAGAGLVLDDKAPVTVATAVHRVLSDEALRLQLVAAGRRRLDDFSLDHSSARLADVVTELIG